MKTLQQEIVEALRKASGTARKYAKQYDEFALSYHEYMDQSIEFENIASKVESARCENCDFFDQQYPTGGEHPYNEPGFKDGAWMETCGPEFGCWHFEKKGK